jgi:hypothetical protein
MGYLSEVARRRIAAALLALVALIVVMAATDSGPFSDPPTPQEEVRSVIDEFYGAASDGDFKAYCALLTKQAQERVRANAARLAGNGEVGACTDILDQYGKPLEDGKLRVTQVSVSGNRARVQVNYATPMTKGPQPHTVLLEEDPAGWRVYDPG